MTNVKEDVKISVKTLITLASIATMPAIILGGGLLRWSFSMDRRITVAEKTNEQLGNTLIRLQKSIDQDNKEIRATLLEVVSDTTKLKNKFNFLERVVEKLEDKHDKPVAKH